MAAATPQLTRPLPVTLVEDSTHASQIVDLPDPALGDTVTLSGGCSFPSGADANTNVVCTEVGAEGGQTTAVIQTSPFSLVAVPIGTGSVPIGRLPANVGSSSVQQTITALPTSTTNGISATATTVPTSTSAARKVGAGVWDRSFWGGLGAVSVIVLCVAW